MTYCIGMNAVRTSAVAVSDLVASGLGILILATVCYVLGRLHQYFRAGSERDFAYRDGYNTATRELFSLATRASKGVVARAPLEAVPEKPPTLRGTASVTARHRAGEQKSTLQQTRMYTAWDRARGKQAA